MNQEFEELLSTIPQDQNLLRGVEEATKQGAVLPILRQLGWDCFNLEEVSPEFNVGNGRVDYCLLINQKKRVFLEVKRASENLESHEKQLLEYSFTEGIDLAVLTNGLVWWIYLPLIGGNWQQRKIYTIDITQQSPQESAKHFKEFLGRDVVENGSSIEKAKSVKESKEKNKLINQSLPKAWKQLIDEPDEFLVELFSEKVEGLCGHRPTFEQITEYIRENLTNQYTSEPQTISPRRFKANTNQTSNVKIKSPTTGTKQKGAVVFIQDKRIEASSVGDLYMQSLKYLVDTNLIKRLETYIPYATSAVRYLISTEPIHQRKNSFIVPVEYQGYYMEAHKDYKNALNHLRLFLGSCRISMREL